MYHSNVQYTHNIKYPNGQLNPTERKVITRNLCVDTLFRKDYDKTSSTSYLQTLPDSISNVISMNVTAIEFPNAWHSFSAENQSNEFTITVYNAPTPPNKLTAGAEPYAAEMKTTVKIPDGSYRSDLLRDAINNLFLNTGNGLEYIRFDINEINTRCVFRTKTTDDGNIPNELTNDSLPSNFYFVVDFGVESNTKRPLYKNAGWMLGFKLQKYIIKHSASGYVNITETTTPQTYNWYFEGESSYGSGIHNYIYLEIDDFNKNFSTNTIFANTTNETYLGNNIMGRVSVTTGMNTIVTNTSSDCVFKKREYFGPVKLEKLFIRLLNKYGEPIILNKNDYSFVLEIEQLYS
jgi:hypothetical protein